MNSEPHGVDSEIVELRVHCAIHNNYFLIQSSTIAMGEIPGPGFAV